MDAKREAKKKPLSQLLRDLSAEPDGDISVGEIVDSFGARAFGALLFVFALPNLLPLPPGSTTVLGAPLVLFSPQVAIGVRAPWLPRFIDAKTIKTADLERWLSRFLGPLEKIEKLSRPRLLFLFGPIGDRLIGLVCTLLSLILILPIPLGNLAPSATIAILALALFQRDGVIALIGYAAAALSAGLLVVSYGAVVVAIQKLWSLFGS